MLSHTLWLPFFMLNNLLMCHPVDALLLLLRNMSDNLYVTRGAKLCSTLSHGSLRETLP